MEGGRDEGTARYTSLTPLVPRAVSVPSSLHLSYLRLAYVSPPARVDGVKDERQTRGTRGGACDEANGSHNDPFRSVA